MTKKMPKKKFKKLPGFFPPEKDGLFADEQLSPANKGLKEIKVIKLGNKKEKKQFKKLGTVTKDEASNLIGYEFKKHDFSLSKEYDLMVNKSGSFEFVEKKQPKNSRQSSKMKEVKLENNQVEKKNKRPLNRFEMMDLEDDLL